MPAAEAHVVVGTLADIYMTSGLTKDDDGTYRGFVTISCQDSAGNIFTGQSDPDEIRTMALRWLEAAEAADQDRIVMTMLTRDLEIPPESAAGFIRAMREEREPDETNEDIESAVEDHLERREADGSGTSPADSDSAGSVHPG